NVFVFVSGDTSYFRMRAVAYALKDTAALDVAWDNGVVLTRGAAYAGEPVEDSNMPPAFSEVTLSVPVDVQAVEVPAALTTTGIPMQDSTMSPAISEVTLSVLVDGETVEVPAVLMTPGNYCVTAEVLGTLLGVSVTVVDDVLTITTTAGPAAILSPLCRPELRS